MALTVVGVVLAACGVSVVLLLLAEVVTRGRYGRHLGYRMTPDTLWELRPSQRGFAIPGCPHATINSLGFRGPEVAPGASCERILLAGDSFAFGYGVADDETLAHVLEQEMVRRTGRPCQVLNLGVPGYGVYQMCLVVEKKLEEFRPDIVIMVMIRGDVMRQVETLRRPQTFPRRLVRTLLRRSSFAALMKPRLERIQESLGLGETLTTESVDEAFDEFWARDRRRIQELAARLRRKGVDFVFVPYVSHTSDQDFAVVARNALGGDILVVDGIYSALERHALEHGGVARIEEHPELRIRGDGHPTGTSYRIIAAVIADALGKKSAMDRAMETS